jgi:DNA-binding transcriptional regulator YdaS (Cro superfamily)
LTQRSLASRLKFSPQYLNAILKGRKSCPVLLALRIEEETEGKVKAETLNKDVKDVIEIVRKLYG